MENQELSSWPSIPEALEAEMAAQESNRNHIGRARDVLERALIYQFQLIAEGLVAHRVLQGEELSPRSWAAQYLSCHPKGTADAWRAIPAIDTWEPPNEDPPDTSEMSAFRKMVDFMRAKYPPDLQAYEKEFHRRIARRQIRRMNPKDLADVFVHIYGGRVPVWQEGRINAQLSRLGSNLRLFVVSADLFRSADLLAKLGDPSSQRPAFSGFLLGETSPCTSHFKAAFFEFNHEWAVSPYLDTASPGLVDQCRICWRNRMFSGIVWNLEMGSPITTGSSQSLIGHEVGHIIQRYGFVVPGHFASWRAVIREDICRFVQTPKKLGEIAVAFYMTFEQFEMNPTLSLGLLPPGEPKDKVQLTDIVQELIQDRLIELTPDKKLVCHLYDDGREWQAA